MKKSSLLFGILIISSAAQLRAASDTWSGGGAPNGNWSSAANWDNAPAANDFLNFDTSNQTSSTNNFPNGTIFGNVGFNSGAGAFTLSPVLGGDGSGIILTNLSENSSDVLFGGSISNLSSSAQTVNVPTTYSIGNHIITTASGAGQLNLAGAVTRNADATVQYIISGGAVNYTGAGLANDSSSGGGILGGWAVIGLGSNLGDWATTNGSGNVVAYSGYSTKSGGSSMALSSSGGNAANNIKINSRSSSASTLNSTTAGTYDINTLMWNIGNSNPSGDQTLNIANSQILRLGANGAVMNVHSGSRTFNVGNAQTSSSGITAGGAASTAGEISFYSVPLSDGNARLNINAPILDNGSGKVSVNCYGGMTFAQAGTFSGGTYMNSAYIWDNNLNAVGYGPVYIFSGSELIFNFGSGKTFTNSVFVGGYGGHDPIALRDNTGNTTLSGPVTLMSTATIGTSGSATTFNGAISGPGGLYVITSYADASLHLGESTANTYTGNTTIDAAGIGNDTEHSITIWINNSGHNNIMPSGSGAGNLVLNGGSTHLAQFDIGGSKQVLNGLVSSGNASKTLVTSNPGGGVLTVGANNTTSEFDGVIGTSGGQGTTSIGLAKISTGTFTLGGACNYTGVTTVSNGVLALIGSGAISSSSQITVSNNATFDVSQISFTLANGQTLTGNGVVTGAVNTASGSIIAPNSGALTFTNGLTFNTGLNANFQLGATPSAGAIGKISVGGSALALNGGIVNVTYSTLQAGRYTLMNYSAGESGSAANLLLNCPPSGNLTGALDDSISGEIDLVVTAGLISLVWQGDGTANVWDINTTSNWLFGANGYVFTNGNAVTFNDAGSKSPAINLSGTLVPVTLLITNNTGTYTFSGGNISGGTTLTKKGNGTLMLTESGDNFAGGISVSNGTVIIDNDSSAISGGTIVGSGGTVQLGNNDSTGVPPTGSITDNGGLLFNRNDSGLTINTVISGTGSVAQIGSGTTTLSANNLYSGGVTVTNGILQISGSSGYTGLGNGNAIVTTGGTLTGTGSDSFGYGSTAPSLITISGGTVTDTGNSSYRITLPNLTFNGGTLTSDPANVGDGSGNYSLFGSGGTCTVTTVATNVTATISANGISVQSPTTFNIPAGTAPGGVDLLITSHLKPFGSQSFIKTGSGTMVLDASGTATGASTVSQGILQLGAATDSSALTSPVGTGPITNNATLLFASSQSVTANNVISGTGNLIVAGGAAILGGANSFTGTITVTNGTLRANNINAFNNRPITETANGAQIYHSASGTYGGTYSIVGFGVAEADAAQTHLGAIRLASAGIILSNTITLTGDAGISSRGSGSTGVTISGQITGGYGVRFNRTSTSSSANSGTIYLSNTNNNWTGDTTIADGTLKLAASGVIPNGNGFGNLIMTNAGANFNAGISNTIFDLNGFNQTVNGLSDANSGGDPSQLANLMVANYGSNPVTLTVGNNNASGNYGGNIANGANALSLIKIGSGTLTLSGVNTFTGNTTVSNGVLALGGSATLAANFAVGGGAKFDVSGFASPPFSLGAGQAIGNLSGTAIIIGSIDASVATLSLAYASGTPSLNITNGTLTLAAGTTCTVNNSGAALAAGTYKLISKTTAGNAGSVAGSAPTSVTVIGSGLAGGMAASLQISSGELNLVVAPSTPPVISGISVSGTTLTITATGGTASGQFTLLGSTNVALPLAQWSRVLTNNYDSNGNLNLSTNIIDPATPQEFYLLLQ